MAQLLQATSISLNKKYTVLIELKDRTHSQQARVVSYLKADWLLHAYAISMLYWIKLTVNKLD